MPTVNKTVRTTNGDSMELLETSAMTGGERVRARLVFAANSKLLAPHVHQLQDETYEVLSGDLGYTLDKTRGIAKPGQTVTLPRGISHQHYAAGPDDVVAIVTMSPGLDFDYLLENFFGLGSEGNKIIGSRVIIQALVWRRKLKAHFTLPGVPGWIQNLAARLITPVAYRFGYRAVYQRFSGEEW